MAKFDSLIDNKMRLQATTDSTNNNVSSSTSSCTNSNIDSKHPARKVPLHHDTMMLSTLNTSFNISDPDLLQSSTKPSACGVASLPSSVQASLSTTKTTTRSTLPLWWSNQMNLSSRSLMEDDDDEEESLDEDRRVHSQVITPAKRKASCSLLDEDDSNDSDDQIARHMRLTIPSAFRSSKMPRRCHSMFPTVPSYSSNMVPSKKNHDLNNDDELDDDEVPLPPPLLFSEGSLSTTTTSRTVTDTMSHGGLEEYDDDDDDDDDVALQASLMGRPLLQRNSTIKDAFDMATSIEAFRTSLMDQQHRQE